MSALPFPEPVEVRHERSARRFVVSWDDGHVSPYGLDIAPFFLTASGLKDITLKIGSDSAVVNGKGVQMEKSASIIKSRTIVPLTFIGIALDVTIDVDPNTGHVLIRKKD